MRQPIDSRLHGALDYLTGASLVAAALLAKPLRGRFAGRALGVAGVGHVAYSVATDYELGLVRKLPYKVHLVLDALGAIGLAAAGAMRDDPLDRWVPVGIGLYELGAVALSDPNGRSAAQQARRAVTVEGTAERVRTFLSDPANVRTFSPDGSWTGRFELRPAPGGRGVEIHAEAPAADLRRAKQLLEAGEIISADDSPSGRRGLVSALLPSFDDGRAS
jgi:hypothetical protein